MVLSKNKQLFSTLTSVSGLALLTAVSAFAGDSPQYPPPEKNCYVSETAWARDKDPYNDYRYYENGGNWATYIPYAGYDIEFYALVAGQHLPVGYVVIDKIDDYHVEITVRLTDGARFSELEGYEENLHIQGYDYAPDPNSYKDQRPIPGQFDFKEFTYNYYGANYVRSKFEGKFKIQDYFGIHVVVDIPVECPTY